MQAAECALLRRRVLRDAGKRLIVHARAEQLTLYAALAHVEATSDFEVHSVDEYEAMRANVRALLDEQTTGGPSRWLQAFISSVIEHLDEEETQLFECAKRFLSRQQEVQLGREFLKLRRVLFRREL